MAIRRGSLTIVVVALSLMPGAGAPGTEQASAPLSSSALQEIARLEAEIDRIEAQTV